MQAYVIHVIVYRTQALNVKVLSAEGLDRSTARPFTKEEFAPGKYLVEGPARKSPSAQMTLAELAEWFHRLDGSWGKEIGDGMQRYKVWRLPG